MNEPVIFGKSEPVVVDTMDYFCLFIANLQKGRC